MMTITIDDLPPAVPRPVQWRRLWLHLGRLRSGKPEYVLDSAYSVGDAVGGMSDERHLRRLLKSDKGQRLLAQHRDKPQGLCDVLADRAALAAMPAGSVGREFLRFAERHQLDPRKLLESQHAMSRDYAKLDPVRQWLSDRLTVLHDLTHVLAGYDAVPGGESALMCFSLPQRMNDRIIPVFILMSVAMGNISMRDAWRAISRGKRAAYLVAEPLEDMLALPLADVRRQLQITPPHQDHAGSATSDAFLIPA